MNMDLQVEIVEGNDLPRLIEIEFAAYANSPEAMLLRGRDMSNVEHYLWAFNRYENMLSGIMRQNVWFRKVVDKNQAGAKPSINFQDSRIRDDMRGVSRTQAEGKIIGWLRYEHCRTGVDTAKPYDYLLGEDTNGHSMPTENPDLVKAYWSTHEYERRLLMGSEPHNCESRSDLRCLLL